MPLPTDGFTPATVDYQVTVTDVDTNSALATISAPGWSILPGWQDNLEAAVVAFHDALVAGIGGVTGRIDRTVNAVVNTTVEVD